MATFCGDGVAMYWWCRTAGAFPFRREAGDERVRFLVGEVEGRHPHVAATAGSSSTVGSLRKLKRNGDCARLALRREIGREEVRVGDQRRDGAAVPVDDVTRAAVVLRDELALLFRLA